MPVATHYLHVFTLFRFHTTIMIPFPSTSLLPIPIARYLPRCAALEPPSPFRIRLFSIDPIFVRVRCTAFWWLLTTFSRVIYCTLYHHHPSSPSLPAGSSILIFLHHNSCLHANSRFVIVSFPLLLPSLPVLPSLLISRCLFAAVVRNANC
jgi:hypothetical protein